MHPNVCPQNAAKAEASASDTDTQRIPGSGGCGTGDQPADRRFGYAGRAECCGDSPKEQEARGFDEIAVVYRTHRQARLLERYLKQERHSVCSGRKRIVSAK